jgi:quinolinate synthase
MKLTSLESVVRALEEESEEVVVEASVRENAKRSVERMISIG